MCVGSYKMKYKSSVLRIRTSDLNINSLHYWPYTFTRRIWCSTKQYNRFHLFLPSHRLSARNYYDCLRRKFSNLCSIQREANTRRDSRTYWINQLKVQRIAYLSNAWDSAIFSLALYRRLASLSFDFISLSYKSWGKKNMLIVYQVIEISSSQSNS